MLKRQLESAHLYMGRNAGRNALKEIQKAKLSIQVISPYLSPDYVDLLIKKQNSNVDVSLITSTSAITPEMAQKLITQIRHVDVVAKQKRTRGLRLTLLAVILTLLGAGGGAYMGYWDALWALAALPVLLFIRGRYKNKRIYSYTYEPKVNLTILYSPHDVGFASDIYLPHAKMFVIDQEKAFLGSINYTKSAFIYNYESCITLTGDDDIASLLSEFDYLQNNANTMYMKVETCARSVYREPKN